MDRRTYLQTLGVGGLVGSAGCLEDTLGLADDDDDATGSQADARTVLAPPERSRGDPDVAAFPVYGQEFPSFSLPDPLAEESVSREDVLGDRAIVMTFFFTSCPDGACPALLERLRHVQRDAAEHGYEDDVALLAMTFDPERDTPDVLEEYAATMSIDDEADNWRFLRPETYEEVEDGLAETFGIGLERLDDEDLEADSDDGSHDHDHDDDDGDHHHDHGEYTFQHTNLILLANEEGIVERSYPQALNPDLDGSIEDIVTDARTVARSTAPDPEADEEGEGDGDHTA